jgi:uncharacterized damage-inducible protein DinB
MTDISQLAVGWRTVNSRLRQRLTELRPEDFGLAAGGGYMPIWAILGHLAGTRVYWLCSVLRQPGAESTPFFNADYDGWEDHLEVPRSKDEVLVAMDSSWQIVERWLEEWSPVRLQESFSRTMQDGTVQFHSHHSVFVRMMTHHAFHAGEVSLILGMHGLEAVDLWRGLELEPLDALHTEVARGKRERRSSR